MEEDWGGDMQWWMEEELRWLGKKRRKPFPTHTPRDSTMTFMKWGNNMILKEIELSHKFGFLCEIHGIIEEIKLLHKFGSCEEFMEL
jgi:hypothetical protein